jgi:hypothetical protein
MFRSKRPIKQVTQKGKLKVAAKITFEFKDSSLFRIIHADGVFGGPTPSGDVYLSFFYEHGPMPSSVTHSLEDNLPGPEIMEERVASKHISRTNEVGVIMGFTVAVNLKEWLAKRIADMVAMDPKLAEVEAEAKKVVEARLTAGKVQ